MCFILGQLSLLSLGGRIKITDAWLCQHRAKSICCLFGWCCCFYCCCCCSSCCPSHHCIWSLIICVVLCRFLFMLVVVDDVVLLLVVLVWSALEMWIQMCFLFQLLVVVVSVWFHLAQILIEYCWRVIVCSVLLFWLDVLLGVALFPHLCGFFCCYCWFLDLYRWHQGALLYGCLCSHGASVPRSLADECQLPWHFVCESLSSSEVKIRQSPPQSLS